MHGILNPNLNILQGAFLETDGPLQITINLEVRMRQIKLIMQECKINFDDAAAIYEVLMDGIDVAREEKRLHDQAVDKGFLLDGFVWCEEDGDLNLNTVPLDELFNNDEMNLSYFYGITKFES